MCYDGITMKRIMIDVATEDVPRVTALAAQYDIGWREAVALAVHLGVQRIVTDGDLVTPEIRAAIPEDDE